MKKLINYMAMALACLSMTLVACQPPTTDEPNGPNDPDTPSNPGTPSTPSVPEQTPAQPAGVPGWNQINGNWYYIYN